MYKYTTQAWPRFLRLKRNPNFGNNLHTQMSIIWITSQWLGSFLLRNHNDKSISSPVSSQASGVAETFSHRNGFDKMHRLQQQVPWVSDCIVMHNSAMENVHMKLCRYYHVSHLSYWSKPLSLYGRQCNSPLVLEKPSILPSSKLCFWRRYHGSKIVNENTDS
jgi:hypothetical protein